MVQGSMSCVKYLMFIFNFVFVVCGIILIVIGAVVQKKELTMFMDSKYVTAPTILIVVGCVIFILAFLGCCGAVKENSCMVTTFGALLFIIFVVEIAGAATAYVYRGQLETVLKVNMNDSIRQQQKDAIVVWDEMQTKWECCGVDGATDYTSQNVSVPKSCCKQDDPGNCDDKTAFKDGCFKEFLANVKSKIALVGGVAIGIAFVELVGVMFAWCLSSAIKREYEGV